MGPTWVLSDPCGPHVIPINLAIRAGYGLLFMSGVHFLFHTQYIPVVLARHMPILSIYLKVTPLVLGLSYKCFCANETTLIDINHSMIIQRKLSTVKQNTTKRCTIHSKTKHNKTMHISYILYLQQCCHETCQGEMTQISWLEILEILEEDVLTDIEIAPGKSSANDHHFQPRTDHMCYAICFLIWPYPSHGLRPFAN